MSDRIKDLLTEVADGVEPGDRLDAIRVADRVRAAYGPGLVGRRRCRARRRLRGDGARADAPAVRRRAATRARPTSHASTTSAPTEPSPADVAAVPVYFVGDTPDGPRLYREFRTGADRTTRWTTFALDAGAGRRRRSIPTTASAVARGRDVVGAYEDRRRSCITRRRSSGDLHARARPA